MKKKQSTKPHDLRKLRAALDLYDNAPCGSVSFNNDGSIFDINNTLAAWLGYKKEEIINVRTLPSLFRIGGQIFFETHFFPLIKLQGYIKEVYFDIIRKDKTTLHALINVREIPAHDDVPISYQATILDISDRWNFESELLKAKQKAEADSKAKAEFLSTISHEIRTPLNSILGIGNLLHKTPLNKNQKEYARLLLHSSEHLLSLVNNLLDLSKIEAKKIALEHVDFDILEMTTVLEQTFSVRAREKGIELSIDLGEDIPQFLVGDPVKLNQILTNLIGNAIKFTKKGSVTLSVSVVEKSKSDVLLEFNVIDTGIGIPKEKLELIFQEFSQASYDVSVEFGGTGLGLTISKKLLELHGSKLIVKSELNVGSRFNFNIRYAKSDKVLFKDDLSILSSAKHNFDDFSVLIVDDNPANIFIAEQYMDQWNVSYSSADSGQKAISILEKNSFDLILLDLQMPKMNGYETAKKIRQLKLGKKLVIVAFSASTKGEVTKELLDAGIDDHLPKPFQPQQLYEILHRYHKGPRKSKISSAVNKNQLKKLKRLTKDKSKDDVKKVESFNLTRYEKMANNKPEYLKKFKLSTLDALKSYQTDFQDAIEKKNVKQIADLLHRSTMSLYYIQADPLTNLLKECRRMLEEKEDEQLLSDMVEKCNVEFNTIISGLSKD